MASYAREEIVSTAEAIQRYLLTRPNASETVDGVARWWLLKQRFHDSLDRVQMALDMLEEKGEVIKVMMNDGREIYRKSVASNDAV